MKIMVGHTFLRKNGFITRHGNVVHIVIFGDAAAKLIGDLERGMELEKRAEPAFRIIYFEKMAWVVFIIVI